MKAIKRTGGEGTLSNQGCKQRMLPLMKAEVKIIVANSRCETIVHLYEPVHDIFKRLS